MYPSLDALASNKLSFYADMVSLVMEFSCPVKEKLYVSSFVSKLCE